MVGRMPRWWAIALVAGLLAGGCEESDGGGGERPPEREMVRVELDLPRPEAGAPDAGTRAGHGGDRYLLRAAGADPIISGRVVPAAMPIELADASGTRVARVNVARDGRFSALLPRLPRTGAVTLPPHGRRGAGRAVADRDPRLTQARRRRGGECPRARGRPHAARRRAAAALRRARRKLGGAGVGGPRRAGPAGSPHARADRDHTRRGRRDRSRPGIGRVRADVRRRRSCAARSTSHPPRSRASGSLRARRAGRAPPPGEHRGSTPAAPAARCAARHWADATNASGLESFSESDPVRVLALAEEVPERHEQARRAPPRRRSSRPAPRLRSRCSPTCAGSRAPRPAGAPPCP